MRRIHLDRAAKIAATRSDDIASGAFAQLSIPQLARNRPDVGKPMLFA
jgi:hypothetical protein